MTQNFAQYTETAIDALDFNPKSQDILNRKQDIIKTVESHYNAKPSNILFYGFSPLMLVSGCQDISVTAITPAIQEYLDSKNVKYTHIPETELSKYHKHFNWVVAVDEYYTFAKTEQEQQQMITTGCDLAKDLILTTLRDYKNQDFREKEFSQPLAVHANNETKLFLEYHSYDFTDRNSWNTTVYQMHNTTSKASGPFARRSMFFKQMAKFSIDAGAKNFFVHKNLMYKSLIRKNYEHVITIAF